MTRDRTARPALATSPFAAPPAVVREEYAVDERVNHDRFGIGTVVGLEPRGVVVVDFGSQRVRVPNDARLCKL
ncbi:hypothetical protein [Vallicoccus soli]|uniref:hypothetical protein n=1 Tax=Vallicoccus soli TaxID=2339232 RepID=UPI001059A071|nr:hypothetical protein [Vallicoccus soli]